MRLKNIAPVEKCSLLEAVKKLSLSSAFIFNFNLLFCTTVKLANHTLLGFPIVVLHFLHTTLKETSRCWTPQ